MPKVSEALYNFLQLRKTPANADLIDRWDIGLETQANVVIGDGEPVAGKRSTWSSGTETWWSIRIPKDANSEPSWKDYKLTFSIAERPEGIGCTGWDWKARRSRWFGFDFDSLTSHAKGVGISDEDLLKVKEAAMQLPYVEVRKSTGGGGIHLYAHCTDEGIVCENHTVHALMARCILGKMSSECNFDFASQIDCCGGVLWIWHRKMSAENQGLTLIKPATKALSAADLPANWRDHIEVATRKRAKVRVNDVVDDEPEAFEALTTFRNVIPLDDNHKAQIEALQTFGYTTLWVADHHLLQTHTCALKELRESREGQELGLVGVFETNSAGQNRAQPNCFLFPLTDGGWRVFRFSPGTAEASTWSQDGEGWTTCHFNHRPDLATACTVFGGVEREQGGYVFASAENAIKAAKSLGQELTLDGILEERRVTLKAHKDGRLVAQVKREKDDKPLKGWDNKNGKYVKIFKVKADTAAARADLVKQGSCRLPIKLITSAALDSNTYELEYLIEKTLVAKQPCIVAGPKKSAQDFDPGCVGDRAGDGQAIPWPLLRQAEMQSNHAKRRIGPGDPPGDRAANLQVDGPSTSCHQQSALVRFPAYVQ